MTALDADGFADTDRELGRYFRERAANGWLKPRLVERPEFPGTWALMLEIDEGYTSVEGAFTQMSWNVERFEQWGVVFRVDEGTAWLFAHTIPDTRQGR